MPTMIASREIHYGGRTIMPGERFEAHEPHVRILAAIKKATPAPPESEPVPEPEPAPRPVRGRRAALPPDPEPVPESPALGSPADPFLPPNRYARRDLRPADDVGEG
jgi:hypothetical protein